MSDHAATSTGLPNLKLAMWLFLASDCLLFGALISTYVLYRGASTVGPYPADVFDIPFTSVSSFVLLASSLTMVLALAAIQRGDVGRSRVWLLATALLGMAFLGGQVYEFTTFVHEGLTLKTNVFGTSFYVLTGFHGTHVAVGVLMLLTLFTLSFAGKITQDSSMTVELVGLYWHFVDIVWIVIFTVVYLIPTGNPGGGLGRAWPRRTSTTREPEVRARAHAGRHPGPKEYIRIAIILAAITAAGGRHLLHRGVQGDPRPAPVLLLVRQVHASSSCGSCTSSSTAGRTRASS